MKEPDNWGRERLDTLPSSWIAPQGVAKEKGITFRARKRADREALAPKLTIAAESYYVLYLNGERIGIGPARGTRRCNFADEYDISSLLVEGENLIAVEVFCNNFPTFMASPAQPALIVMCGETITDASWEVQLADEYRTEGIDLYTLQIGMSEWRDLSRVPTGWTTGEDQGKWFAASEIEKGTPLYAKLLFKRDVAMLRNTLMLPTAIAAVNATPPLPDPEASAIAQWMDSEPYTPLHLDLSPLLKGKAVEITPPPGGGGVVMVLDMGDAFAGTLHVEVDAPQGTILDAGYGEKVMNERLPLALAHYRFADRYLLAEGRQVIESPLRWRGGRFLQLAWRQFARPITITKIAIHDRRYPLEKAASFECDDTFHNRLWEISLKTLSACALDTIIDCPWRELSFWVNDFLVVNRFWLQMVGTSDLLKRCITLAMSQREANGLIAGVCPTNDNPFFVLYATNLFLPMVLRDLVAYSGERDFSDSVLDETARLVEACEVYTDANGLLHPPEGMWNFVDWSFHFTRQPLEGRNSAIVNWFHVLALDALAQGYEERGDHAKQVEYSKKASEVQTAIDQFFWNEEEEYYTEWFDETGHGHRAGRLTHALAFLSGHLAKERRKAVEAALFREDLHLPELYMMHFLFEALLAVGGAKEVDRLIRKHWAAMIECKSPTVWEANVYEPGPVAYDGVGSLCHAFAIAPVNVYQRYLLGITPTEPGFRRFRVDPHPGELREIRGSVPTPHGMIECQLRKVSDHLECHLSVPQGTIAVDTHGNEYSAGEHTFTIPGST